MNREHVFAQFLLRSWPFPRGAGRITDKLFSNLSFTDETVEVPTSDGFNVTVMPNELVGRHIYLTGEFDRSIVEMLCILAKQGDTLLDVGANIGYVSACFLKNVSGSNVIAVEPQPVVVDLLRKNLSQFPARHQIIPVALSDRDGICYFQIDTHNRGASKIVTDDGPNARQIEMWSVDKLVSTAKPLKIDLVKVDVEGHEEQVLAALAPALDRYRPRAILFEDHTNKSAPNRPIGTLLHSAGYEVFGLNKRLTKLQLKRVNSENDCVCNDYVALKNGTTA